MSEREMRQQFWPATYGCSPRCDATPHRLENVRTIPAPSTPTQDPPPCGLFIESRRWYINTTS